MFRVLRVSRVQPCSAVFSRVRCTKQNKKKHALDVGLVEKIHITRDCPSPCSTLLPAVIRFQFQFNALLVKVGDEIIKVRDVAARKFKNRLLVVPDHRHASVAAQQRQQGKLQATGVLKFVARQMGVLLLKLLQHPRVGAEQVDRAHHDVQKA